MTSNAVAKVAFVAAVTVAPTLLAAGPRVDFSGRWCSECCGAWCPYDQVGYYSGCFPDLDATLCEYNDKHFLFVGGCS